MGPWSFSLILVACTLEKFRRALYQWVWNAFEILLKRWTTSLLHLCCMLPIRLLFLSSKPSAKDKHCMPLWRIENKATHPTNALGSSLRWRTALVEVDGLAEGERVTLSRSKRQQTRKSQWLQGGKGWNLHVSKPPLSWQPCWFSQMGYRSLTWPIYWLVAHYGMW